MLWFFDRDDKSVKLETRFDRDAKEYVLSITWPDAQTIIERHVNLEEFRARVAALQRELDAAHWTQRGSPTLILEDWWGPTALD